MKYINGDELPTFSSFPITVIISRFNHEITRKLYEGAISRLESYGFHSDDISVIEVPGAVEIPLIASHVATLKKTKAIIALGAVIRGETTHYDYVCSQVSDGCQKVALDSGIPVIFGILTTENKKQALDRVGGKHGHKGIDAVNAAVEMVNVLNQLTLS